MVAARCDSRPFFFSFFFLVSSLSSLSLYLPHINSSVRSFRFWSCGTAHPFSFLDSRHAHTDTCTLEQARFCHHDLQHALLCELPTSTMKNHGTIFQASAVSESEEGVGPFCEPLYLHPCCLWCNLLPEGQRRQQASSSFRGVRFWPFRPSAQRCHSLRENESPAPNCEDPLGFSDWPFLILFPQHFSADRRTRYHLAFLSSLLSLFLSFSHSPLFSLLFITFSFFSTPVTSTTKKIQDLKPPWPLTLAPRSKLTTLRTPAG